MKSLNRIAVVTDETSARSKSELKRLADSVTAALESNNEVLGVTAGRSGANERGAGSVLSFLGRRNKDAIRRFAPDFVVYIPTPDRTLPVFLQAFMLRRAAPKARHGMIFLAPLREPRHFKWLPRRCYPGTLLVSSYRSLLSASRLSLRGDVLPMGVDLGAYRAAAGREKDALRERLRIRRDAFVFLVNADAELRLDAQVLAAIRRIAGAQVAVFGEYREAVEKDSVLELESKGIKMLHGDCERGDAYRLADCLLFPGSIAERCPELPLCVLEALASGIPVLARPFGGLRDFLPAADDLVYWDTVDELEQAARRISAGTVHVRSMDAFGWNRVADQITTCLAAEAGGMRARRGPRGR